MMEKTFERLQATYGFTMVDGHRSVNDINMDLQSKIEGVLTAA
jgi:hypothetical protein